MILDKTQIKKDAMNFIDDYIYNNIFVCPASEFRTNMKLISMNKRPYSGIFRNNTTKFILPDPELHQSYFVYVCKVSSIYGLIPVSDDWIRTDDLNNNYKVCFDVYDNNGIMIPKSGVFVKRIFKCNSNEIFFAIPSIILDKLGIPSQYTINTTDPIEARNLYMTMTTFFNVATPRTVISFTPLNNEYATIQNVLDNITDGINYEVYINGINYEPSVAKDNFTFDDLVDVYIDENILFEHEFDLSTLPSYLSTAGSNNVFKSIIHFPKELNSNRKILTYDEMRIFVRTASGKGLFLSYISNKTAFQLTFNDFSISSNVIEALSSALNNLLPSDAVTTLKVNVFSYGKPSYFKMNRNWIKLMYDNLSDERIIYVIRSILTNDPDVWSGKVLEKSQYIKDIYNYNPIVSNDTSRITNQFESLGYYNYLSLVSSTVFKIDNIANNNIEIMKPVVWKRIDCVAIVYINGIKINENNFSYTVTEDKVLISINGIIIDSNDTVYVRLMPNFNNDINEYDLSVLGNTITVTNQEIVIYQKVQQTSTINEFPTKENDYNNDPSLLPRYKKIAEYNPYNNATFSNAYFTATPNTNDENLVDLEFTSDYTSDTFYIQPKNFNCKLDIDIDSDINEVKPLVYNLEYTDNQGIKIPIFSINSIEVYLNGKYLIENIGFKLVELINTNTNECRGYQLVINSIEYLEPTNNKLEIFISSLSMVEEKISYSINNRILRDKEHELWIPGLSFIIVDGEIVDSSEIKQEGHEFVFENYSVDNGTPCLIKTVLPRDIIDIFSEYDNSDYFNDLSELENYLFSMVVPVEPNKIIVPNTFKLYSVYLNQIIYMIINDIITVTYSTIIDEILVQLQPYDYLLDFDLTLFEFNSGNIKRGELDLRFIDIFPTYLSSLTISSTEMDKYKTIHALIEYYLGTDTTHNIEVIY